MKVFGAKEESSQRHLRSFDNLTAPTAATKYYILYYSIIFPLGCGFMKFTCEQKALYDAVSIVSRAVSSKTTVPALEGILMRAEKGLLHLSGYDLEIGISTCIDVKVDEEGEIVLNAKLFNDMLRNMPGGSVTVSADAKNLTEVRCGLTEYTILGMPAVEYPQLPQVQDSAEVIDIPAESLKSMIDQTLFAVAVVDTRPALTGVKFIFEDDLLTMVSLDGFQLAVRKEPVKSGVNVSFIVPGKALSEINKMINDDIETVSIALSKKHLMFNVGDYSLITRLLEGEFIDYKKAIPVDSETEAFVNTRALIDCIERASLIINDRLRSSIKISVEEGAVTASCSTALGRSSDKTSCKKSGPDISIRFNNKYLLDALKAANCDAVRILFKNPLAPIKILPPEGDSFLFLVLPVMVKGD